MYVILEGVAGGKGRWRVAPMPRWDSGFGSSYWGGSTTAVLSVSVQDVRSVIKRRSTVRSPG